MRVINDKFVKDLLEGELSFFLEEVKTKRDLLSLEIRGDYINIYYRGGNIVRIAQSNSRYSFFFDVKYCRSGEYQYPEDNPHYQTLASMDNYDAQAFIKNLPVMRSVMDAWFKKYPKKEREYQQNLQSENAFVVDIEHQYNYDRQGGMRFDMIIVDGDKMYVTENKIGTSAIGGNAGVVKHYTDICNFLDDDRLHQGLIDSVIETSKVKHKLGLLEREISQIDPSKTEILFVFGEYNHRSKALGNAVKEIHNCKENYSRVFPASYLMPELEDYKIRIEDAKDLYAYEN